MVETVWRHAEVKLKLITLIKCAKRRGVDERSFCLSVSRDSERRRVVFVDRGKGKKR